MNWRRRLADLLSGRRDEDFRAQLSDLRQRQEAAEARAREAEALAKARAHAADADAMLDDSWRRLERPREGRALAVVSPLPPAETGIAFCTLSSYARAPFPVDIFAPFATRADYVRGVDDPRFAGGAAEAFALSALPRARARRVYAGEVFTFGNSPHHLPSYAALRARAARCPLVAHLHEPFLIDLLRAHVRASARPFADLMRAAYGARYEGSEDSQGLASAGLLGAKALFHDVGVTRFAVNSETARALLLADWPELEPSHVRVLFHPVFPPAPVKRESRAALRIGSFGVPGWLKQTPLLIEAFRLLRERMERPVELWLAGFDVDFWTRGHGYADEPGLVRIDAPGDSQFEALMGSVDLAVQLRARTLGESSGVVAQLLALGVPVLASRIGSFAEFGEAVAPAPDPHDAESLADAIARELAAGPGARSAAICAYVAARTPERFCADMWDWVEDG